MRVPYYLVMDLQIFHGRAARPVFAAVHHSNRPGPYLNTHDFRGFNKVNLNAWKKTGFQRWLRTERPRR